MLRTPFDFPFDPATHPLGEKLVSVADPLESAVGPATYYLAKRFYFEDGDYTINVAADDAATVWLGTSELNSRLIASPTLGLPENIPLHITQGEYRMDVVLQNLPVGLTPCYFSMIIRRGGEIVYLSDKVGWNLDDAPINDDDLPPLTDQRFLLPVFSVLPNWDNGITERLSWVTDVLVSEGEAQQRRSVRRYPRRSFEAAFLRKGVARMRMDAFFVGVGMSKFLLPIWHEQLPIVDGLSIDASGVVFPNKDTNAREFRENDLVFVTMGDPNDYDILKVGTVEDGRFNWAEPPKRAWPPGVRIYPLRLARRIDDPQMSNITDDVATVQARFDLVEPDVRQESWGQTMDGEPILRLKPDRGTPVQSTYSRKYYLLDNTSGQINVTDTGRYSTLAMQLRAVLKSRQEAYAFRQFLAASRGRARHFFCSSYTDDVRPQGNIVDGTIDLHIEPMGYWQYFDRPQPLRLTLAFDMRDNAPTLYRRIVTGYAVYKTDGHGAVIKPAQIISEVLTLDAALPEIDLAELVRISFITETHFDQDEFELHHVVAGQEVVELALALRQAQNPRKAIP